MKIKITILILCAVVFACKKNNNVVLSTNLTGCPINTTCSYSYFDNADFDRGQPVAGHYRAFFYNNAIVGQSIGFCFKTALSNSSQFVINSEQIAAGQFVAYNFICPSCDYVLQTPIGGEIKGQRTDATHWLINASIVLGNSVNMPLDTLIVNQYFTLEKLP